MAKKKAVKKVVKAKKNVAVKKKPAPKKAAPKKAVKRASSAGVRRATAKLPARKG